MGTLLSGRRCDRPKSDDCVVLRLPDLRRRGILQRGHCATWRRWWQDADGTEFEFVITADLRDCQPAPVLMIACKQLGVEQCIALQSIPQPLGGESWYALCPRLGTRCRALYLVPGQREFASLKGSGASYSSTREQPRWRALRALEKAQARKDRLSRCAHRPTRERVEGALREAERVATLAASEWAESWR